jgi:hypothetical protein
VEHSQPSKTGLQSRKFLLRWFGTMRLVLTKNQQKTACPTSRPRDSFAGLTSMSSVLTGPARWSIVYGSSRLRDKVRFHPFSQTSRK